MHHLSDLEGLLVTLKEYCQRRNKGINKHETACAENWQLRNREGTSIGFEWGKSIFAAINDRVGNRHLERAGVNTRIGISSHS